ncbi:MAG: DUF4013 domain-containing protein [Candidatus Bathyarchaeia archaeon]
MGLDLSENLRDAFEYSKGMADDAGRWIALAILGAIPILNFVAIGYAARIISEAPGSREPPRLADYMGLWTSGLKVFAACLIYMIIPMAILGIGAFAFLGWIIGRGMMGLGPRPGWAAWPTAGFAGIALLIGIAAAFLIAIVAAMGIAHMVRTGRFVKAFAFGEIVGIIGRVGWGDYIIWLIAIFAIALIFSAIGSIPWIGWLISLILMPPFLAFVARSTGSAYASGAP